MNNISVQNEIINLEIQYWSAMKTSDVETAVSLTRFPCIVTSPKGVMRVSEDQYRKMMKSNKPEQFKNVEINDPKVDVLNDKTALISYSFEFNGMNMLDVSTWVHEDGKWLCAFHSENPQT